MRRWRELSGVERVAVYTNWSLYLVLVVFNGSVLASATPGGGQGAVLLAGGAAVSAAALAVMVPVLRSFPAVPPLPRRALAALLVASAALAGLALGAWEDDPRGAALTVVVASATLSLGLLPGRRVALALVAGAAVLLGIGGGALALLAGVAMAAAFLFTGRASLWMLGIVTDLDVARQAQGRLAVAEERLRFSRDVHDVLGRRLSTIAVQAELAATLAERGDPDAAERMLAVRGVAHEALREARDMARGYRATDFLKELEGAGSLLRSAGIALTTSVEGLPRGWHEAAAWVVREAVTNVLRHSRAGSVAIAFSGEELTVVSDGVRPGDGSDGTGLRGLHERLAPLGASLEAGAEGERWVVLARLPGTGPLSATGSLA